MRMIINNEISLIIIFRYCYNNIDFLMLAKNINIFPIKQYFSNKTILLTRIIIFFIIFFKKLLILGKNIINFCAKYH